MGGEEKQDETDPWMVERSECPGNKICFTSQGAQGRSWERSATASDGGPVCAGIRNEFEWMVDEVKERRSRDRWT